MEPTVEQKILDLYDPLDVRTWFFYPIYMPLNKDGYGPETRPGKVFKETWEVWNIWCDSYGNYDFLPDAINQALFLNNKLLEGKTIDQINSNFKSGH